jgi:tRNA uracil 4-sulfurtransferase
MFILRYHEIALKGGNRSFFESRLKSHLKEAFVTMPNVEIHNCRDHFEVDGYQEDEADLVRERLGRVFGVVNFSEVEKLSIEGGFTDENVALVGEKGVAMVREYMEAEGLDKQSEVTFRVSAVRRDKSMDVNSMEIARKISGVVLPLFLDLKVQLVRPQVELFVEWDSEAVLMYVNKESAAGGLPTGSAGKVVSLISAGFDSPVASWMMMKRGATVVYVHFHSYPAVGMESVENVKRIMAILNRYQLSARLYLIPLVDYQKFVVAKAPAPLRVLLYRRMMFRLAQRVVWREKAKALVTGESLGQVASQTLQNIHAVDVVSKFPVFRPLIGTDKQDIIDLAEKIGTAEISSQPYEDCCSLYIPKSPALAARPEELEEAEAGLDVARFEEELWGKREVLRSDEVL